MKILVRVVLLTLLAVMGSTHARDGKDDLFFSAANKAHFDCGLRSGTVATARQYGQANGTLYGELNTCLREANASIRDALKSMPDDEQNADLRNEGKAVYAAWITLSDVLAKGVRSNSTQEERDFKAAIARYRVELALVD